jgi:thioredoxin-like negative regulator of GroEL
VVGTTNQVLFFIGAHCTTCKAMTPAVRAAADAYGSSVELVEIDVATNRDLAERHSVRTVPTFVAIHEGSVAGRAVGAQSRTGVGEVFAGAEAGQVRSIPLSSTERLMRLGAAAAVGTIAFVAGQPWLLAGVMALTALAFWDRMPLRKS